MAEMGPQDKMNNSAVEMGAESSLPIFVWASI